MSEIKLRCDRCKHEFEPVVKEKPAKAGGMLRFFRCPKCKHSYPIATYTKLGVELLAKLQALDKASPLWLREHDALVSQLRTQIKRGTV